MNLISSQILISLLFLLVAKGITLHVSLPRISNMPTRVLQVSGAVLDTIHHFYKRYYLSWCVVNGGREHCCKGCTMTRPPSQAYKFQYWAWGIKVPTKGFFTYRVSTMIPLLSNYITFFVVASRTSFPQDVC